MSAVEAVNPTTLAPLGTIKAATDAEIETAVSTVAAATDGPWPRDAKLRANALHRWADLLERDASVLQDDLVAQTGKPMAEARIELNGAIDALRYNAGLSRLLLGTAGRLPDGSEAHLAREPVGPTVFIVPWNWPVLLLLRDLAPAYAAGVTAIIKPASQTALVTRRVIDLGYEAGVPRDVLVMLTGEAEAGSALVRHPSTRAVAITGSTEAGQAVMRDAAETLTRPLLELGGKAAMLVLPDGDLDAAVERAARASIITSGQMCMACTRVLVHRNQASAAEKALSERIGAMRPGDPRQARADLGPLVTESGMAKVESYLNIARADGRIVVGGVRVAPDDLPGHFITPALVTDLDSSSRVVQDDVFGPVLSLEVYDDEDEAIELVNGTGFGLAAAVWTGDVGRGFSVARRIQAGTVWINGYNHSYAEMPSGGMRMSGLGRTRGVEGIEQFTELKHVHIPA